MPRITPSIPNLPNENNIKNEELKGIVRQYNLALQQLIITMYGDISDHEERIKDLES